MKEQLSKVVQAGARCLVSHRWPARLAVLAAAGLVLRFLACGFDTDADGDGFFGAEELRGSYVFDCDDNDATVRQGVKFYLDADDDGFGDNANVCFVCLTQAEQEELYSLFEIKGADYGCPEGNYRFNNLDCDDDDDEQGKGKIFYRDADEDGLGDPNEELAVYVCPDEAIPEPPEGYVQNANDCDDSQSWLGGPEGVLNTFYLDFDGDSYGDPNYYVQVCSADPPPGNANYSYVSNALDCDDQRGEVSPDALFDCPDEGTAVDDNCNGVYDEDAGVVFYFDGDEDGYGTPDDWVQECPPPEKYVREGGDCDDDDDTVYPGTEGCLEATPTPESGKVGTSGEW